MVIYIYIDIYLHISRIEVAHKCKEVSVVLDAEETRKLVKLVQTCKLFIKKGQGE